MLELNRSATHATRGRDGRQEGRERGYYNLHRNLNETLFHNSSLYYSLFTLHYSLDLRAALVFVETFASVATVTADTRADHEG